MSLASLQSAMYGPARTVGEFFDTQSEADAYVRDLKASGAGNPRKSKFHDYTKRDGTKVYKWVVRCNQPKGK